jgi:hypothetical protein
MARPAISDERVIIEGPESIRVKLKNAWADGTHSLLYTPSKFLEHIVALIPAPKSTPRVTTEFLQAARRIGDIYQTSQLRSLTPNMGPMGRIQVYDLQVPRIKNRDRAKENASPGLSFSNALSKSMSSSLTNAVDA